MNEDAEPIALENAIQGGVVVTMAAGNDGSMTHTIDSPGTTDDAITVGSVTNSHELLATITTPDPNLKTIGYSPSADGVAVNSIISAKVVDIQQSLDSTGLGCSAFASGSLSGSIALIERGTCTFSVKAVNAAAAGAEGSDRLQQRIPRTAQHERTRFGFHPGGNDFSIGWPDPEAVHRFEFQHAGLDRKFSNPSVCAHGCADSF